MEHITDTINQSAVLNAVRVQDQQGEITDKAVPVLATPALAAYAVGAVGIGVATAYVARNG